MDSEIIKSDNGLLCVRVQLLITDKLKMATDKSKYDPYTGIFESNCDLGTHVFLRAGYITTFLCQFNDSHVRIYIKIIKVKIIR